MARPIAIKLEPADFVRLEQEAREAERIPEQHARWIIRQALQRTLPQTEHDQGGSDGQ